MPVDGESDSTIGSGGIQAPAAGAAVNPVNAVFISYASQDTAVADALCAALERTGIACWIAPRNVVPGDFYADSIVQAINACKVLVLVLSDSSINSPHVVRDIDILQRFGESLTVGFSIPTDSNVVRKAFEPRAPSISRRLQAAQQLKEAGIRTIASIGSFMHAGTA